MTGFVNAYQTPTAARTPSRSPQSASMPCQPLLSSCGGRHLITLNIRGRKVERPRQTDRSWCQTARQCAEDRSFTGRNQGRDAGAHDDCDHHHLARPSARPQGHSPKEWKRRTRPVLCDGSSATSFTATCSADYCHRSRAGFARARMPDAPARTLSYAKSCPPDTCPSLSLDPAAPAFLGSVKG